MNDVNNSAYQQFITAVETAQQHREFDGLYATMGELFQIKAIHPATKAYIESTIDQTEIPGPVYMDGFGKCYKNVAPITKFYSDERIPNDRLLPALLFAYTTTSHEYYLFFESGQVIGGFHETFWIDNFDSYFIKANHNIDRALKKFMENYGLTTFTYTQFAKMQQICREEYGITSPLQFPGTLKGDDFVKILTESGKDKTGRIVCYLDDIVCTDVLAGLIDLFDDFYI